LIGFPEASVRTVSMQAACTALRLPCSFRLLRETLRLKLQGQQASAKVHVAESHEPSALKNQDSDPLDLQVSPPAVSPVIAAASEAGDERHDADVCTPASIRAPRERSHDSPAAKDAALASAQQQSADARKIARTGSGGSGQLLYAVHPSCARRLLLALDGPHKNKDSPRLHIELEVPELPRPPRCVFPVTGGPAFHCAPKIAE
jgi:hypothetical protein